MNGIKSDKNSSLKQNKYYKNNNKIIMNIKLVLTVLISNLLIVSIYFGPSNSEKRDTTQKYILKKDHSILALPIKSFVPMNFEKGIVVDLFTVQNTVAAKQVQVLERYIVSSEATVNDLNEHTTYKVMIHNKYLDKIINSKDKIYTAYPHKKIVKKKLIKRKRHRYEIDF